MSSLTAELAPWAVRHGLTPAEQAYWTYCLDRAPGYPQTSQPPYIQRPKRDEHARPVLAGELVCGSYDNVFGEHPLYLLFSTGTAVLQFDLQQGGEELERLGAFLEHDVPRGAYVAFWDACENQFHKLLRWLAPRLTRLGWLIYPYATGSEIVALNLRRGKCSVLFTDALYQTREPVRSVQEWRGRLGLGPGTGRLEVDLLQECMAEWQSRALTATGVGLRVSLGGMAVSLAARHLPEGVRWFRTPRLTAALCRAGGGYRGGYCYAEPYTGPAWKVDMVRAYTWALASPLPCRTALWVRGRDRQEVAGIFLCSVEGRGNLPAHFASLEGDPPHKRKRNRWVGPFLTVLEQQEFGALRALEYQIRPICGVAYTRHVNLSSLADALSRLHLVYGRGSVESTLSRNLANNLYGRLAESPERTQVVYSVERPDATWYPYVATTGRLVDGVWVQAQVRQKGTQHVEAATAITARVRARLYSLMAEWLHLGGRVVHADTDGLLLANNPVGMLPLGGEQPGDWRLVSSDEHTIVHRAKWYHHAGRAYAAGVAGLSRSDVELVASGGHLAIHRRVLMTPWDAPAENP